MTDQQYRLASLPGPSRAPSRHGSIAVSRELGRSGSRVTETDRPLSPSSTFSTGSARSPAPLATPIGFMSPKKPPAAIRHEARESQSSVRLGRRNEGSPLERIEQARFSEEDTEPLSMPAILNTGPDMSRDPTRSMTDVNSPVRRPLELSTDTLIRRPTRPPDHSNGHAHTIEPIIPTTSSKPVQRQRRYTQFENAMTTFFCSGYLMTGNDNPASFILALVLLFGIAGVWYGTTGVWFWQSGTEYGLAPGGGIAINVILAFVMLPGNGLTRQVSVWHHNELNDGGGFPRPRHHTSESRSQSSWNHSYGLF